MIINTNAMMKSKFLNFLYSDSKKVFAIRAQAIAIRAIIESISISSKTMEVIDHIEREINITSTISLEVFFMLFTYKITILLCFAQKQGVFPILQDLFSLFGKGFELLPLIVHQI